MLWKFNNKKVLYGESLSTFVNRFKLRFEACRSLAVAGFEHESESIEAVLRQADMLTYIEKW